ncbi:unnamed protein product [Miscanthus lutarioriparius]|uniref:Transposase Tnp1/En/Spm-like domain-containing protein n=1 Tax=Miscanthus lutarioriparius TaxID=422564 RepID=A0A811R276_9POAL|nr:unnamed protein product [Miscanthus lutarioriparius]
MSEEHIGQESHGQNTEVSELHSSARGDQIDSDGDIEVNLHDETEDRVKRGKTKLKDIWNLPKGHRIVVRCNEFDQPVGAEAGFLGKFLGMVARNGCLCSLSYKDWRLLIGKKEKKNTDEQKNKKDILKQVKMRFLYPYRMEKWILRTIGERWREHKSNLRSIYFDEHKSTKANHSNVPNGIIADQWIALVDNWTTQKALDISKKNRVNCTKKKSTHTTGTKSFARNREESREKDPEKKYPHRAVLYIHTHQTRSEKNTNAHVGDLKELIVQQPGLAETSQGKVAWKGDALSKILGEEKPGHVHGLGLVPNPNQVFDVSTSKRLKNVNLTSLDATSSEDVVSLRLQLEKHGQHVRNQDSTILQLQQKTRTLEHKQIQQGCLDDPVYAPKDGYCAYVPNTKRKRVYSDPQNQDSSMDEQLNDTMNGQADNVEDDDLQPHYKYLSLVEKRQNVMKQRKIDIVSSKKQVVAKETSATPSNFEASDYQNKISTTPSATVPASV